MSSVVDGKLFFQMVKNGAKALAADCERINALNVFPVPDGDTGTNMKMTIEGGISGYSESDANLSNVAKGIARSMVLSARGNSGVILSQFFKGLSLELLEKNTVDAKGFADAMVSGYKRSYSVVSNPTEGTILTVMREAAEYANKRFKDSMNVEEYLNVYLEEANNSLKRTPELLPILKKSGVIDSGGAGFILIVEGMLKCIKGEDINYVSTDTNKAMDVSGFNADSELTYGYCTEFILQLQNSKVDPGTFDLNIINNFLNSIGNSIVSFKDDDIIKVHVHTFDPGIVLTECRRYGEFLTLKIENMNVQHSELDNAPSKETVTREHKEFATVTVANGAGLVNAFKEMGVDEVVTGGQTMNTSTQDFIDAFEKINADNIFVYPNNGNILMAAKMAADTYDKANVYVIPTRTIVEGYSAISMLDFDMGTIDEIINYEKEVINNVSTLEVTYSVRNTNINDIEINKGDYICIYKNELIACHPDRLEAIKQAFRKINDFEDKQVLTVLCGQDVHIEEVSEITNSVKTMNPFIEVCAIQGDQDIYSYIIGIE